MTIPPRFMQELRDRLSLSDLIGRRVKLTRAGREYKGCCPFHNEKTPSFYVNDDKQFYHCFGCGAHGDAIGFVMQHDNLSFVEAIEALAAQAGMQVPQSSPEEKEKAKKVKDINALMNDATRFMCGVLHSGQGEGHVALTYLRERGLSDETISAFNLGYAPADGQAIRKHLREEGYSDAQMIEAGVIRESNRGGEPYAFFRERIIFPVADRRGRVVAFGGRILPDHLRPPDRGDFTPPKYINSSDTPLFQKGRMLYGESHARQAAIDGQDVLVVEGYTDVIACHQAGVKGAVAPLGTALTEEQIESLWRLIPEAPKIPVLCFDGDEAGRRAAWRAAERILPMLKPDHSASFVFLPEGEDPDSLIKAQGAAGFKKRLAAAQPLVDFIWAHYTGGKRFTTPEARAGLADALDKEALKIAHRDVQYHYKRAFRDRQFQMFRNVPGGKKPSTLSNKPRQIAYDQDKLRQKLLLAACIQHPDIVYAQAEEILSSFIFSEERLEKLRQTVLNEVLSAPSLDREGLMAHLNEGGFDREMDALLGPEMRVHGGFLKKDAEADYILECVQGIRDMMRRVALQKDVRAAGEDLKRQGGEALEKRLIALQQEQDDES